MASEIERIDLYNFQLTYVGGSYVMSNGRVVGALDSTVARVQTRDGLVGFGESCPLGPNYLPAHASGARAALADLAPQLLGLDAADPVGVAVAMDAALLGHAYAKSAVDIACWDVFGKATGRPICDLLGGRRHQTFPLYVAISLGAPEQMAADIERHRAAGIHHFQLKLGGDPDEDVARARAAVEATSDGDLVVGDVNRGWSLGDALHAALALDGLPRFWLEQPCATLEECFRVAARARLPLILDESIVDVETLLRAWNAGAMVGFNLKLSRVGGLTKARALRDLGAGLGLNVSVEDSWGGDLTTAAVSHLAASTPSGTLGMVSFMNDWTNERLAGHQPRSVNGVGAAPRQPGLGIEIDEEKLGEPFASFAL